MTQPFVWIVVAVFVVVFYHWWWKQWPKPSVAQSSERLDIIRPGLSLFSNEETHLVSEKSVATSICKEPTPCPVVTCPKPPPPPPPCPTPTCPSCPASERVVYLPLSVRNDRYPLITTGTEQAGPMPSTRWNEYVLIGYVYPKDNAPAVGSSNQEGTQMLPLYEKRVETYRNRFRYMVLDNQRSKLPIEIDAARFYDLSTGDPVEIPHLGNRLFIVHRYRSQDLEYQPDVFPKLRI